jgi:hypothetical protein
MFGTGRHRSRSCRYRFAGGVQLRVCDGSRHFGEPRPDSRGLQLIDRIATQWGVDSLPNGKAVWAEIRARA